MKVHLQVDGSPAKVGESARGIAGLGADGMFSFEGQHDVFFPLVVAAGQTDLELMTNVAIAGPPRRPWWRSRAPTQSLRRQSTAWPF